MPTEKDARRVAAEAGLDPRTVARAFAGKRVRSSVTLKAILDACEKLEITWTPPGAERTELVK